MCALLKITANCALTKCIAYVAGAGGIVYAGAAVAAANGDVSADAATAAAAVAGFGDLAFSVADVYASCETMEKAGVGFKKSL